MKLTLSCKEIYRGLRGQRVSMRMRFVVFLMAWGVALTAVLLCALGVMGVLDPAGDRLERAIDRQLDDSVHQLEHDMDELAAYAVEFSQQMTGQLEGMELPFEQLCNNGEALSALQAGAYDTVLNQMRLADCSGAFFLLNTTVNNSLEDRYYSGLYLKYANVGSETILRNSVCMFRGSAQVARQRNINLFSTWEYETREGTFPQAEALMTGAEADPVHGFVLTDAYRLPQAWEKVRLLCAPVADAQGRVVGVCGFEISDPFFQAGYQASSAEQPFLVCALLEERDGRFMGQFSSNRSGYRAPLYGPVAIVAQERFTAFSDGESTLVGKTAPVHIGGRDHTVAVLLPQRNFEETIRMGKIRLTLLLIAIAACSIFISSLLSRRYIRPLLRSLEQLKARQFAAGGDVTEVADLFEYLAQQDQFNKEALDRAEQEKTEAMTAIEQMQLKYDEANRRVERLAYSRRDEIDPDDYQHFKAGLHSLTDKEREIFELYLSGKSAKEIVRILCIQESTLKFHNHNMLGKLGVSSRKQMLRYAALAKQEESSC